MSPLELKSAYLNVPVQVPVQAIIQVCTTATCTTTTLRIGVRSYRNASINYHAAEKNRVTNFMRQNNYSRTDRIATARAFNGKASVQECQIALAAIWQSGFAGMNLQNYCDAYLGVDCSGFVNNYFLIEYALAETNINGYYHRGSARRRTNFADFRARDVLIWCDARGNINTRGRHIAVIDSVQANAGNELRASVVESTGTLGLVDSTYTFIETSRSGIYRVHRPLKPSQRNHVQVVPVI